MKKKSTLLTTFASTGIFLSFLIGLVSCTSSKHLTYFRDLPDSTVVHLPPAMPDERLVQNGDRIDISIGAKDQEAADFFNKKSGGAVTAAEPGYLVDYDGMVEVPVIGKVKTSGLTAKQVKDKLTGLVSPYLKEPLVEVRFVSFRITVLGEVHTPGSFALNAQRTTILDALAAAGDLPHSAKRYDIRIFRDYNGQRTITKIDLRKKDILYDPEVFQMKHNDVIYVQPRNKTIFTEDLGLFTTIFSLIIGVFALVFTVVHN